MEISQSRQSASVSYLSFARQLARHAFSFGFLAAAGAQLFAVCGGAGARLGIAISTGDLLASRSLVDSELGRCLSSVDVVSDEYLLPTSTRNVSDLR